MNNFEIRWKNFRSLRDTKWISIRPITIIVGANATGKTSFLAPLLLLKQTLESSDQQLALKTVGKYFDAGSYENLIYSHDKSEKLSLGIRFRNIEPEKKDSSKDVGKYPPGEVEFEFAYTDKKDSPILNKFSVRDIYGRLLVKHNLLKSGSYSETGITSKDKKSDFSRIIKKSMPDRFLFTAESIFTQRVKEQIKNIKNDGKKNKKIELKFTGVVDNYLNAVSYTKSYIERILREISYVGPLSQPPRRMYELSGEKPDAVGTKGEFAPEILYRKRNTEFSKKVDHWIKIFGFGKGIKCNIFGDGVFNLRLLRTKGEPEVNIADTGFGLSQVLPLIVQGQYAKKHSLLIAEQPEVHLNPKLQSLLADLFVDIANNGSGVLLETHSEHLLLRLRRLIAEGKVNADKVAIYFIESEKSESIIREVPVYENGHIDMNDWPKGFFEDSLSESMALATAQIKKKKNG